MALKDKVIIVGASSGIGMALARIFSQEGSSVGITGRRSELLSDLARQLPGASFIKRMDVAKPEEASVLLEELIRDMGGVDIIVICSGTGFLNPELVWQKERDTIDVNVTGFSAIAAAAIRFFIRQGRGHLVGITSVAAIRPDASAPAYGASKAFAVHYLAAMRFKVRKMKLPIFVTDIQPGFVDTAMAKGDGLFWVSPVDKAARQIFDAIRNRRRHAYITHRWRIVAWVLKIIPDWLLLKLQ